MGPLQNNTGRDTGVVEHPVQDDSELALPVVTGLSSQAAPAGNRIEAAMAEIRGKRAKLANRTHDAVVRKHSRVSASICETAERTCANETIAKGEPDGASAQSGAPEENVPGPKEKATKVCNKHLETCGKRTNTTRWLCKEKSHKERAKKEWRSLAEGFSETAEKEKRVSACQENEAACKNSVKDCSTKCNEHKKKEKAGKERSWKSEQYHKDEKKQKNVGRVADEQKKKKKRGGGGGKEKKKKKKKKKKS